MAIETSDSSSKETEEEVEKPRRRISGNQPPELGLGKTNLSFVLEESEDEDKDCGGGTKIIIKSRDDGNNEVFTEASKTKERDEFDKNGESETKIANNNTQREKKISLVDNNGNFTGSRRNGSVTSVTTDNGTTIVNNTNNNNNNPDRRRSSAEVIRQSRAYKRFSKALSQISLIPNQSKDVVYHLEGMEEEVRSPFIFLYFEFIRCLVLL